MLATFKFLPGRSVIHRLDPRTKIIFFALILVASIIPWDVRVLGAVFVLVFFGYYLQARLPWRQTWKAWAVVLFFSVVLLGFMSTLLFGTPPAFVETAHPAVVLPRIGPFQRTIIWEMAFVGAARMLRPLIIVAAILPFTFTTDPYLYGVAFRRLGLPDGVAYALDLSLRYVPTIARDFFITMDAQRARGYELERRAAGVVNMIRRAAPLVVPVTIGSIAAGEEVAEAMELRGFGVGKRTWAAGMALQMRTIDYIFIGAAAAVVLAIVLLSIFTSYGPFWFPVDWFE
jgi:energy-coupling factor transport system permease protein